MAQQANNFKDKASSKLCSFRFPTPSSSFSSFYSLLNGSALICSSSIHHLYKTALCALAEISSMRFVNGAGSSTGIMGIDYTKAAWLHKDLGYRAYNVNSVADLYNPFVSVYFAAAYLDWLAQYEGRERTPQFVVQAYLRGPENVNFQETGPLWLKFEEAMGYYGDLRKRREQGSCSIM